MVDDELVDSCGGCVAAGFGAFLHCLAVILIIVMLWQIRVHVIAIRNYLVPAPPAAGANNGDTGSTGPR